MEMTKHFNKLKLKPTRRSLRRNANSAEHLVWLYIRRKQILGERFLRQFSIDQFIIDFYCPKLRLAIEIDGASHFNDEERKKSDIERQEHIESFGVEFLRFKNEGVYQDLDEVIENIKVRVKNLRSKQNQ